MNNPASTPRGCFIAFICAAVGLPAIAVALHFVWPDYLALKVMACGLVLVPASLAVTTVIVALTERKGSILSASTILLPIIGGALSVRYGWTAVSYALIGFIAWCGLYLVVWAMSR